MNSVATQQPKWYAIYTCPNTEKKIYNELNRRAIRAILPTTKVMRQWSDRKKLIEVPLFPNYLFVNILYTEMWLVSMLRGVVRFVSSEGTPVVVKDSEINLIEKLASEESAADVVKSDSFNSGEKVQVKKGPFAGLVGTVASLAGITKLYVELETIHKVISINIDAGLLEKIG